MMEITSTLITSTPSSTSCKEAASYVSAPFRRKPKPSRITSTTVWIAIPPRMFPMAIPTWCVRDALTTTTILERFVAIARIMIPPNASPRPKRALMISVVLESWIPAIQVTTAPTTKIGSRKSRENDVNIVLSFYLLLYQDHTRQEHEE